MSKFKKGSAAAKRYMAKIRRMRKSKSKSKSPIRAKTRRSSTMAKRKTKRRAASAGNILIGQAFAAGIYGASRSYLNTLLAPIMSKIPGGKYADNIVLGTVSYFLAKHGKMPMLKRIGKAGLIVESAMLGADIASGVSNTNGGVF